TTRVLACELLCAAQGLEFLLPLRPGQGVEAAYRHIREHVRPLARDRTLHRDLEAVERTIRSGSLLDSVESNVGTLAWACWAVFEDSWDTTGRGAGAGHMLDSPCVVNVAFSLQTNEDSLRRSSGLTLKLHGRRENYLRSPAHLRLSPVS